MHTITINSLLPFAPYQTGWDNFIEVLNNPAPDQPISITELLDAGIPVPDVIWALRGLPKTSLLQIKYFALECAELTLYIFEKRFPNDKRPRKALETAKRFLDGAATLSELDKARIEADAAYAAYAFTNAANAAAYAASTASVYATASAADYAATNDERAKQAEYLRKHFPE